MEYKTREDVPTEYKWDLTLRYQDDQEWEADYHTLTEKVKEIEKYKGKVVDSSENLFNALSKYFEIDEKLGKLYVYAYLKNTEDLSKSSNKLMLDKASNLYTQFSYYSSYLEPEILSCDEEVIKRYIKEFDNLKEYEFFLTRLLRTKEHILSEEDEKMISLLIKTNGAFSDASSILKDSAISFGTLVDDDGNEVELTQGNYRKFLQSTNRELRKEAYYKMFSNLMPYQNVFSTLLISRYESFDAMAKVRHYKDSFDMTIFDNNVPVDVNKSLYRVIDKRLDVYRKYYQMIKDCLNVKTLYPYDLSTRLISYNKKYSIEEAKELVLNALSCMGDEYVSVLKKAYDERWIDFCTYKGKESGAYSYGNYGNNPVVFLNYNYKLDDVSALAHELGHAVHSYLSEINNTYVNAEHELFVAEVASLTNEILLSNYILNNSNSKEEKAASIYNLLDIIQNNLFDAALEGEFENILHARVNNGETLSTDDLNNTIYNLRKKYYGNTVELLDETKYGWIRRTHYYRPFYLYQYAVGVSSACFAAKKIISGDKEFLNNYLKFLKAGGTKYPVDLLNMAGIDVMGEEVFNSAIDYFDELIDEFKKLTD